MEALRLLCTNNEAAADSLAAKLGRINNQRQKLLQEQLNHSLTNLKEAKQLPPLLILADEVFNEGIIGLIAGRLTDRYYRPSIVISKGENGISKASARSIPGINIIKLIREAEDLLIDAGGHPMAAGFTIETSSIETFAEELLNIAADIDDDLFERSLEIDAEVELNNANRELYDSLEKFKPFGQDNREPLFCTRKLYLENVRTVGAKEKHLKFTAGGLDGIAFGRGYLFEKLSPTDPVDIAFHLDLNKWNGNEILQMKVRDIKI